MYEKCIYLCRIHIKHGFCGSFGYILRYWVYLTVAQLLRDFSRYITNMILRIHIINYLEDIAIIVRYYLTTIIIIVLGSSLLNLIGQS